MQTRRGRSSRSNKDAENARAQQASPGPRASVTEDDRLRKTTVNENESPHDRMSDVQTHDDNAETNLSRASETDTTSSRVHTRRADPRLPGDDGPSQSPRDQRSSSQTQPSVLKFQPKAPTRRSKEEREALERAEKERASARGLSGLSSSTSQRESFGRGSRLGGRGSLRGATSFGPSRHEERTASGPLGGSSHKSETNRSKSLRGRDGPKTSAATAEAEATEQQRKSQVKKEPAERADATRDTEAALTKSTSVTRRRSGKVKKEDEIPTHVSSDEEFESDTLKRINIEEINLVSSEDDENAEDGATASGEPRKMQREATPKARNWMMRPIFIERQEHVERTAAMNTDASSSISAELRRRAKARQQGHESLFVSDEDNAESVGGHKAPRKRKTKDVEFVRDERRWKGVWPADDSVQEVQIKNEPKDDGDIMAVDSPEGDPLSILDQESLPLETEIYEIHDDYAMSSRYFNSLADIEPKDFDSVSLDYESSTSDPELDELYALREQFLAANSQSSAKAVHQQKKGVTGGNLVQTHAAGVKRSYLVQLPPVMPLLQDRDKIQSLVKQEGESRADSTNENPDVSIVSTGNAGNEPEESSTKEAADTETKTHSTITQGTPKIPCGKVGTLTFYASGRAIATWGGVPFEIHEETKGSGQAREIFVTERETTHTKSEDNKQWDDSVRLGGDTGTGYSVGPVWTNFIGVPELGMWLG